MDEEIKINYDNFSEVEKIVQKHQTNGFCLMRHNSEKRELFFKKNPLEENLAKVIE